MGHPSKSLSLSCECRCFQIFFKRFMFRQLGFWLKCSCSVDLLKSRELPVGPLPDRDLKSNLWRRKISLHSKLSPHFAAHWFGLVSENYNTTTVLISGITGVLSARKRILPSLPDPRKVLLVLHLLLRSSPCSLTGSEWPRLRVTLELHLIICSDLTCLEGSLVLRG